MIAAPAVDLKGGRCVQLVGGAPEAERVSLPDPLEVVERWRAMGFGTLHLVDLDAALGSGDNLALVCDILEAWPGAVQVGGGVRDDARAETLLEAGAARVVVGTRALDEPDGFAALTRRHPGRVMAAADTREGYVLRKGWTERAGPTVAEFLGSVGPLPLGGVLATDVGREGRLAGMDRIAVERTLGGSAHPVWVSGGVTTLEDLAWLDGAGAAGAVLGMTLYIDAVDAREVARRWGNGGAQGRGERRTVNAGDRP